MRLERPLCNDASLSRRHLADVCCTVMEETHHYMIFQHTPDSQGVCHPKLVCWGCARVLMRRVLLLKIMCSTSVRFEGFYEGRKDFTSLMLQHAQSKCLYGLQVGSLLLRHFVCVAQCFSPLHPLTSAKIFHAHSSQSPAAAPELRQGLRCSTASIS